MEQEAIEEEDLEKAQFASEQLRQLQEKYILFRNYFLIEQNEQRFLEIENEFQQALADQKQKWDDIFGELQQSIQKTKNELDQKHEQELQALQENFENQNLKFQVKSQFLDDQYKLQQLIKQRNYKEARFVKERLLQSREQRIGELEEEIQRKFNLKQEQLMKK